MSTVVKFGVEPQWIDICGGSPSFRLLSPVIRAHLNGSEDLSNFRRKEYVDRIELELRKDGSRGYVVVGVGVPVQRGYDAIMLELRDAYANKRQILKSFTDFQNNVAGFSWRKPEGEN